jgi:phosphoribosylglycinamide formyltransferase-1
VHLVDEFLDAGPIILQAAVPVLDTDTVDSLSARILVQEHLVYSQAIRVMLGRNFRIEGRRVITTQQPG